MNYTIYKTTNLINGKYYIGKHQTRNLDDGYTGSGKILKRAIRKYGIENFVTDILFVFDEEWKMNLAERILVVPDVETNYNLCPGGQGGFGFINSSGLSGLTPDVAKRGRETTNKILLEKHGPDYQKILSDMAVAKRKILIANGELSYSRDNSLSNNPMWEKKHSSHTKSKMSQRKLGANNNNFGKCWISNSEENKLIPSKDLAFWIECGYTKGRNFKK